MNRKQGLATLLVVILVASTGAAALGGLVGYSQSIGITDDETLTSSTAVAAATDVQLTDAQVVYTGDEHVSEVGGATLVRLAQDQNEGNLTLFGQSTDVQASYFAGLKNDAGDYVFQVKSLEAATPTARSLSIVSQHWTSANAVTLANPQRNRDVIGGLVNATESSNPLIYISEPEQVPTVNKTLQALGVNTIYVTSNVDQAIVDDLDDTHTIVNLSTDLGADYINNQIEAGGTSTLYLVQDVQDVTYVEAAAETMDVMVLKNETAMGTEVRTYLENNDPNVTLVANPTEVPQDLAEDIDAATEAGVTRVTYEDRENLLSRLALLENNEMDPVVAAGDTTITNIQNGGVQVTTHVTNLGFSAAQDVTVTLKKQNATFEFVRNAPSDTDGPVYTWTFTSLRPGQSVTLTYNVSSIEGDFVYKPTVQSYQNTAGTSFAGFSVFGQLANWVEPLKDQLLGVVAAISAAVPTGVSPVVIGGIVLGIIVVGAGVFYVTRMEGKQ